MKKLLSLLVLTIMICTASNVIHASTPPKSTTAAMAGNEWGTGWGTTWGLEVHDNSTGKALVGARISINSTTGVNVTGLTDANGELNVKAAYPFQKTFTVTYNGVTKVLDTPAQ